MYKSALAGLFLCVAVFAATSSSSVNAEALSINKTTQLQPPLTEVLEESIESSKPEAAPVSEQPINVTHTVKEQESLEGIAKQYQTTWKRLFDKNTTISDPNIITVGQAVAIPAGHEILTERPVPKIAPAPAAGTSKVATTKPSVSSSSYTPPQGSSVGNRYTPGYCTWYVKNMRPGLPNNLGNANTWVSRAAAQGMATGSAPQAGAVGQRGMHVVYVESVNADGTVTISEMNHKGVYVRTVRTLPASYFTYIY